MVHNSSLSSDSNNSGSAPIGVTTLLSPTEINTIRQTHVVPTKTREFLDQYITDEIKKDFEENTLPRLLAELTKNLPRKQKKNMYRSFKGPVIQNRFYMYVMEVFLKKLGTSMKDTANTKQQESASKRKHNEKKYIQNFLKDRGVAEQIYGTDVGQVLYDAKTLMDVGYPSRVINDLSLDESKTDINQEGLRHYAHIYQKYPLESKRLLINTQNKIDGILERGKKYFQEHVYSNKFIQKYDVYLYIRKEISDILLYSLFTMKGKSHVLIPMFVVHRILEELSNTVPKSDDARDALVQNHLFTWHVLLGVLAELYGEKILNKMKFLDNAAITLRKFQYSQALSDELDLAYNIDAIFLLTDEVTMKKTLLLIDYKNNSDAFGSNMILDIDNDPITEASSDETIKNIKQSRENIQKLIDEGCFDYTGATEIRKIWLKVGIPFSPHQIHFSRKQTEYLAKKLYKELASRGIVSSEIH